MTIPVRQFTVGFAATDVALQRAANDTIAIKLEKRLGRLHARQRLGIETDHEAHIFGQGINFFHIENWYSIHSLIRTTLKLSMGSGAWKYHDMVGYTSAGVGSSIVAVRLNCPPEIALHHLRCDAPEAARAATP